jgi:hypothetical protein
MPSAAFRHCEKRSFEAIQKPRILALDCFASLAMTERARFYPEGMATRPVLNSQ